MYAILWLEKLNFSFSAFGMFILNKYLQQINVKSNILCSQKCWFIKCCSLNIPLGDYLYFAIFQYCALSNKNFTHQYVFSLKMSQNSSDEKNKTKKPIKHITRKDGALKLLTLISANFFEAWTTISKECMFRHYLVDISSSVWNHEAGESEASRETEREDQKRPY